jgi:hypothetical protein
MSDRTDLAVKVAEAWYDWRQVACNRLPAELLVGWERREKAARRKFDRATKAYAAYRDAEVRV